MKEESDTNTYKLKLLYIALYVPIAQLSQSVASEINSVLTKDNPVKIQYRNIEIRPYTIPKDSPSFYSELLFSDIVPARIVVFFVETAAKNGSQTKNPFSLKRRWTVPKQLSENPNEENNTQDSTEKRLREVEETNKLLLQNLQFLTDHLKSLTPKSKGKGRGKSSSRPATSSQASTTAGVSNDLQNINLIDLGSQRSESQRQDDVQMSLPGCSHINSSASSNYSLRSTDIQGAVGAETKEVWIKSIDLTINGASIDQGPIL